MSLQKYQFLSLLVLALLLGCERDDICLEGTPGTPRLVVVLRDAQNRLANKPAPGLVITGTLTTTSLPIAAEDSLLLPLNAQDSESIFEFRKTLSATQTLATRLAFQYDRYDMYINRACGYKAQFTLNNPAILGSDQTGWIESYEVVQDTITDETQTHIYLYH